MQKLLMTSFALLGCLAYSGTAEPVGAPVSDNLAAELCGGACTGYKTISCTAYPGCASQCYEADESQNEDQNTSTLGDVCKTTSGTSTRCDSKFTDVDPCGGS